MTLDEGIRSALSWLATYGLHSTLFLGGAWLLCAVRRPRVDRNRERIWKFALVGGLITASLQVALGARPLLGGIDWSPAAAPTARATPVEPPVSAESAPLLTTSTEPAQRARPATERSLAPHTSSGRSTPAQRPERVEPAIVLAHDELDPAPVPKEQPKHSSVPASAARVAPVSAGLRRGLGAAAKRWPGLVLASWTTIGLLGIAGLIGSWTCLRRRMLGREILREGALVDCLARLRTEAHLRRAVRLSVSPRIQTPFSTGLLVPEICLPTAVCEHLTAAQQEVLLAHELAHLARFDPTWFGASFLIEKLFFFQPLNRLARSELAELAETACDDWAVRWTGARLALASCLTEVAGWMVGERTPALQPGLGGHRSRLGRRIERLLDDRRSPAGEPPARWWTPLAAALLATTALAVPGVSAPRSAARTSPRSTPPPSNPLAAERVLAPTTVVPEPEPLSTPPAAHTLDLERGVLDSDLTLLEAEIGALHAELEARELRERFAGPLERIDARMDALRLQHQRARELLARLQATTPATATAPSAASPVPVQDLGDSR